MTQAETHDRTKPPRNGGLDALRAVMTLLVLFHHTAITYGGAGSWYYREVQPDGSITSTLLLFFNAINQAYFMGVFFLLAGYFTHRSLQSKVLRATSPSGCRGSACRS